MSIHSSVDAAVDNYVRSAAASSVLLVDCRHPRRPRTRALSGVDVFLKDAPGPAGGALSVLISGAGAPDALGPGRPAAPPPAPAPPRPRAPPPPRAAPPARPAPPEPHSLTSTTTSEITVEDLPGARRTTARWRTTTHTGITAGPGHHAGSGAEHDIEVTGRTEHLSNAQ